MKQVEEEYYKLIDSNTVANTSTTKPVEAPKKDTLLPITPLRPLVEQAKALPPELLDQIVSMAKAEPTETEKKAKLELRIVSGDQVEGGSS